MPRVIYFEVSADQPERAIRFYTKVFGWKIQKWEGTDDYWMISTGDDGQPGIDGGLVKRRNPADTIINTIDVSSIDEFLNRITNSGGQIAAPKFSIPGVGYFAYCRDPEGNTFSIMQYDETAQ